MGGAAAAGALGAVRVFLSFWQDPEAAPGQLANRLVTVYVHHANGPTPLAQDAMAADENATLYIIDDAHVHPAAQWQAMGAPPQPNSSQLAALMAASRVHVERVPLRRVNASCASVDVPMGENSAVVVAFA
jgi:hypothetical protein